MNIVICKHLVNGVFRWVDIYNDETNLFYPSEWILGYYGTDLASIPCIEASMASPTHGYFALLGSCYCCGKQFYVLSKYNSTLYFVSLDFIRHNIDIIFNCYMSGDTVLFYNNEVVSDLTKFYSDNTVEFIRDMNFNQSGSGGVSVKFVGRDIRTGKEGVVKFPIIYNGEANDCINELLCYDLGVLFNVPCCRVLQENSYFSSSERGFCILSVYEYSVFDDDWLSFNQVVKRSNNGLFSLSVFERLYGATFLDNFFRCILFDYIVGQTDRHLSNLAVINNHMYPLYDNGRCLSCAGGTNRSFILTIINAYIDGVKRLQLLPTDVNKMTLFSVFNKYYSEQLAYELTESTYNRYCRLLQGGLVYD